MDEGTRQFVRERSEFRCEYCRLPQAFAPAVRFHVEHIRASLGAGCTARYRLRNQSRLNLKFARKHTTRDVHVERRHGRFRCRGARKDRSRFSVQHKVQMPSQQPRLEGARAEKRLHVPPSVFAGGSVSLCQIAAGTTECQIAHRCLAALRAWNDVFDVKGDPGRRFQQPAVFTRAAGASDDELPVGLGPRHVLLGMLRFYPNGNGHSCDW